MDVVDLREFYASPLGNTTRKLIANRLKAKTGSLAAATVLGLGYAMPYLEEAGAEAGTSLSFMMARQGVIHWPAEGPVRSALVDETDLPLLESAVDIIIAVHALELCHAPAEMLREVWRVLAPQGRLLLVVPNRRGLWARFDTSPFGQGQPFSRPQLAGLLRNCEFSILSWSHALYFPPSGSGMVLSSAGAMESVVGRIMPAVSGVLIVEAVKQVYAIAAGKRVRKLSHRLRPALLPAPSTRASIDPSRDRLLFPSRPL
ncbi:MAG: methyltransferase domain-containing protein [Aestuariivirga sp.]